MLDLSSLHKPDIFLIQETKMEEAVFLQVSQKFWKSKGKDAISSKFWKRKGKDAISSRGASGGIGTLWNDKEFDTVVVKHSNHWILTQLRQKVSNSLVSIFNIYAPNSAAKKNSCWNLLREEKSNLQGNIIIAGDLNVTLSQG